MAERTAKVSFGFLELTPTQKGIFGDNVIAKLSENIVTFPTPDIPVPDLTTINGTLKTKTQEALSGDKIKIEERELAEKAWDEKFRKEGEYVQRIASGSKLVILQGGYQSTETEISPVAIPAQPILDAWGNKGKGSGIHAEVKPLADARGIVFVIAEEPIENYAHIKDNTLKLRFTTEIEMDMLMGTKRKVDFEGVQTGKTYFITAFGFNASGIGQFANPIEVTAP